MAEKNKLGVCQTSLQLLVRVPLLSEVLHRMTSEIKISDEEEKFRR